MASEKSIGIVPASPTHSGNREKSSRKSLSQNLNPVRKEPYLPPAAPLPAWYSDTPFQAYLQNATTFVVKQQIEMFELVSFWETPNRYTVRDHLGNKVFFVGEESDSCQRVFCCSSRPLNLQVRDSLNQTILNFERPLSCSCLCGLLCKDVVQVKLANGQRIGLVEEAFSLVRPKLNLKNATGKTKLILEGPSSTLSCCGESVVFKLLSRNGALVGTISKEWLGQGREPFTEGDYFNMSFPIDLDPSMKAVCLAALFLVDLDYFEAKRCGKY